MSKVGGAVALSVVLLTEAFLKMLQESWIAGLIEQFGCVPRLSP